jgi:hypothetical protein
MLARYCTHCNPSTGEAEVKDLEFKAYLGYIVVVVSQPVLHREDLS